MENCFVKERRKWEKVERRLEKVGRRLVGVERMGRLGRLGRLGRIKEMRSIGIVRTCFVPCFERKGKHRKVVEVRGWKG